MELPSSLASTREAARRSDSEHEKDGRARADGPFDIDLRGGGGPGGGGGGGGGGVYKGMPSRYAEGGGGGREGDYMLTPLS